MYIVVGINLHPGHVRCEPGQHCLLVPGRRLAIIMINGTGIITAVGNVRHNVIFIHTDIRGPSSAFTERYRLKRPDTGPVRVLYLVPDLAVGDVGVIPDIRGDAGIIPEVVGIIDSFRTPLREDTGSKNKRNYKRF